MDPGLGIRICLFPGACLFLEGSASEAAHAEGVGPAVGVDAVVRADNGDLAALDVNGQGLDPLIGGGNIQGPVRHDKAHVRMERVVSGRNGQAPACQGQVPCHGDAVILRRNGKAAGFHIEEGFRAGGDHAVVSGRNGDVRPADPEGIVGPDPVAFSLHLNGPAGDDQVIIGGDPVLVGSCYSQGPGAGDGQVVVGKNGPVGSVRKGLLRIGLSGGYTVLAPLSQDQEDLVRLADLDAGVVRAGNGHPVQDQPDLGILIGVHGQGPVRQGPGDQVGAGGGDDHAPVIDIGAGPFDGGRISLQGDDRRSFGIRVLVQVIVRKVDRVRILFGVLVRQDPDAQLFSVHEKDGQDQHAHHNDHHETVVFPVRHLSPP